MKRIALFLILTFAAVNVFAGSAKYDDFMKKAKDYESKEEWAYALGFYADAMAEEPTDSADAYKRFSEICTSIESGKPGVGEYKGIKLYNGWKNLLINAEKYWTEYCPWNVNVGPLEVVTMSGSKVDYAATVKMEASTKYVEIMESIVKGYVAGRQSTWDLPEARYDSYYSGENAFLLYMDYWPYVSASKPANAKKNSSGYYPVAKEKSNYEINDVLTYTMEPVYNRNWNSRTNKYNYEEKGIQNYYNAFAIRKAPQDYGQHYYLYDLKIKLVDENGKEIKAGQRILPYEYYNESCKINFSGISMSDAEKIDEGKVVPALEGAYLQYGYQNVEDYETFNNDKSKPTFKSHLPEKSIDVQKVNFIYQGKGQHEKFHIGYKINTYSDYLNDLLESQTLTEEDGFLAYKIVRESGSRDRWYNFYDTSKATLYNNESFWAESRGDENRQRIYLRGYEVPNLLSILNGYTPCYDSYANRIDGNGYYWTGDRYSLYITRAVSETEAKEIKNKTWEEAKFFIENKNIAEQVVKHGLYSEYGFEYVPDYISELESAINNDNLVDAKNSLSYILKYTDKTKFAEYEIKINNLNKTFEEAQSLYNEKKAIYDEVSEFQSETGYYSEIGKAERSLSNLKSAVDSKNFSSIENYKKEVEQIKWNDFKSVAEKNKKLLPEAKKLYEEKKALYEELYSVLKNDSNYSSKINSANNNLRYLKSAVDSSKYSNIEKYKKEVEQIAWDDFKAAVEKDKKLLTDAKDLYKEKKALYDELYSVLKNDSNYSSKFNGIKQSLSSLDYSISNTNYSNIEIYKKEVEQFAWDDFKAAVEKDKTLLAEAKILYKEKKALYDELYSVLKNDSNYSSKINSAKQSLSNLDYNIGQTNYSSIEKYKKEVEQIAWDDFKAAVEKDKKLLADATSLYNEKKAKYDLYYPKYGKSGDFSGKMSGWKKSLDNLNYEIRNTSYTNIERRLAEVKGIDFSPIDELEKELLAVLDEARKVHSQKAEMYNLLASDGKKNSGARGKAMNELKKALDTLDGYLKANKIDESKKCADEINSMNLSVLEKEMADDLKVLDDANSLYNEKLESYQNVIEYLAGNAKFEKKLSAVKSSLETYAAAIKSNNVVTVQKLTKDVQKIVFKEYEAPVAEIKSIIQTQADLKSKFESLGITGEFTNARGENAANFVIGSVEENSPAALAKLSAGDVIVLDTKKEGAKILTAKAGGKISVTYMQNGKKKSASIKIK